MSVQIGHLYEFGPFRLDPAERQLLRDGQEVPLPPKAFDVLVVLVSRAGHLVSKEDLLNEVWPGTFVEEASLSYTVSLIRKALQSGSDQQRYIDTVQKLGYRFTPAVRTLVADGFEAENPVLRAASRAEQKIPSTSQPSTVIPSSPWFGALWRWQVAVVIGVIAVGLAGVLLIRNRPGTASRARFDVTVPGHIILTDFDHPVISPDGRRFAFTGLSEGRRRLWVQPLDSSVPIPLPGTDGAGVPFWSPDSRSLGFFADRKLKRIDVDDGSALTLCCDAMSVEHSFGAWGSNGVILFSHGPVYRVRDTPGGVPEPATTLDASRHERSHSVVGFLSDVRRFAFFSDPPPPTYYVTALDDRSQRRTLNLGATRRVQGVSIQRGHLLYSREGIVVAQPFDEQTLELRGAPLTLAATEPAPLQPQPSASRTGIIVFRSSWYAMRQLAWRRRDGGGAGVVGSPDVYIHVELSPNAPRAAIVKGGAWLQDRDLWLADLTSGMFSKLTDHPGIESSPAWSPDGRRIAYHSSQAGVISPFIKDLDTGKEERLLEPAESIALHDWTTDGRYIVFSTRSAVFELLLTGERRSQLLTDTSYIEDQLQVSPDGRWIALNSNESNAWEVYVARFPDFTEKQRVSVAGGVQPRWRRDGKELFYLAPDGTMMALEATPDATFKFGRARELFKTSLSPPAYHYSQFDVTPDGQQFLILEPASTRPQILTFLLNWTDALKK